MDKVETTNLARYFSEDDLLRLYYLDDPYIKAKVIVSKLFNGKVDKSGEPYIGHLMRVSKRVEEPIEKVAALLHDTLEDTEITYDDLIAIGFSHEVLDIVVLLTKPEVDTEGMSEEEVLQIYSDEIDAIIASNNIHAIRIKEADMTDNFDPNRLSVLPLDMQVWFEKKYGNQIKKLRMKLNE